MHTPSSLPHTIGKATSHARPKDSTITSEYLLINPVFIHESVDLK